jgi:hypothetical protein
VGDIKNIDNPDYSKWKEQMATSSQWKEQRAKFIRDGLWSFEAVQYDLPRFTKVTGLITGGITLAVSRIAAAVYFSSPQSESQTALSSAKKTMDVESNNAQSSSSVIPMVGGLNVVYSLNIVTRFYGFKEDLEALYTAVQFVDNELSFIFRLDQSNIQCHRPDGRQDSIAIDDDTFRIILRTFKVKADVPLVGKNLKEATTSFNNGMQGQAAT